MKKDDSALPTGYSYFLEHFTNAPVPEAGTDTKAAGDMLFLTPDQAAFIYDYSTLTLLYARGFEMLGFDDASITINEIFDTAIPAHREPCGEISGKGLFVAQNNKLAPLRNGIVLNYAGQSVSGELVHLMLEGTVFSNRADGTMAASIVVITKLAHLPIPKIVRWRVFGEMHEHLKQQVDDALMRPDRISNREAEVLDRLAKGKTMVEIANDLCRSPRTVERHISNMRDRFDCANTGQLIAFGKDMGLI